MFQIKVQGARTDFCCIVVISGFNLLLTIIEPEWYWVVEKLFPTYTAFYFSGAEISLSYYQQNYGSILKGGNPEK